MSQHTPRKSTKRRKLRGDQLALLFEPAPLAELPAIAAEPVPLPALSGEQDPLFDPPPAAGAAIEHKPPAREDGAPGGFPAVYEVA